MSEAMKALGFGEDEVKVEEKKGTEFETQYHPCSYCGGKRRQIVKGSGDTVVEAMKIPLLKRVDGLQKKGELNRKPLIVCWDCVFKVFNLQLGQALHYGKEMQHLKRDEEGGNPGGFFPV